MLSGLVERRIERMKERMRNKEMGDREWRNCKRRKIGIPRTTRVIFRTLLPFPLHFLNLCADLHRKLHSRAAALLVDRTRARAVGLSFKPDARHRGESRVINYVLLLL